MTVRYFIWLILFAFSYTSNAQQISISKNFIQTIGVIANQSSSTETFTFTVTNLSTSLQLSVAAPFTLSKDNITFFSTLSYSSSINNTNQTVYVKCTPPQQDKIYRKNISFVSNQNTLSAKVYLIGSSLPKSQNLKIASWNMRWFGFPPNCNCDTALSHINALKVLKDIDADIYCLQEVVDTISLYAIVQALGSNYEMYIARYCSLASTPSSGNYLEGQKLAYIIKKDRVQALATYGLLATTYPSNSGSASPYYYFSSGRFPYLLKAKVLTPNGLDTLIVANIHAKAYATQLDYNRRVGAAYVMTDSLNANFAGKKIIIMGDYNDYTDSSQVFGQTTSPYEYLYSNGFKALTKNSLFPGLTSYVGSLGLIDNLSCSANLAAQNADSTTYIFSEVSNTIPNYSNTTSDHFPIVSYFKYDFQASNVGVSNTVSANDQAFILQNPGINSQIHIKYHTDIQINTIALYDFTGHCIEKVNVSNINHISNIQFVSNLKPGMYFIHFYTSKGIYTKKWIML